VSSSFLIGFEVAAVLTMVAAVLFTLAVAARLGAPRWSVALLGLVMGFGGAVSGLGLHLLLGRLRSGPVYYEPGQAERNRQAYMQGCLASAIGVPQDVAEPWCACTMERFETAPNHNEIIHANREVSEGGRLPPVTRAFLVEAYTACGPEVLERGWLAACESSCSDTGLEPGLCEGWCSCLHDELRSGHPGEAGARWMLIEVYAGHLMGGKAGDRALDAAIEVCAAELSEVEG
jgi:hypothetical protein